LFLQVTISSFFGTAAFSPPTILRKTANRHNEKLPIATTKNCQSPQRKTANRHNENL